MKVSFDLKLVEQAWNTQSTHPLDVLQLCTEIIGDLGEEKGELEVQDIVELSYGRCLGNAEDLASACLAVSAMYIANRWHHKRFAHAIFVFLAYRVALDNGYGSEEFIFDDMVILLLRTRRLTNTAFQINLLSRLLCH